MNVKRDLNLKQASLLPIVFVDTETKYFIKIVTKKHQIKHVFLVCGCNIHEVLHDFSR